LEGIEVVEWIWELVRRCGLERICLRLERREEIGVRRAKYGYLESSLVPVLEQMARQYYTNDNSHRKDELGYHNVSSQNEHSSASGWNTSSWYPPSMSPSTNINASVFGDTIPDVAVRWAMKRSPLFFTVLRQ
jgi:hypothetical protein